MGMLTDGESGKQKANYLPMYAWDITHDALLFYCMLWLHI